MNELEVKAAVRARDGFRCTECGLTQEEHYRLFNKNLEVHRLVPGSPYTVEGSVTLCLPCHDAKPISKPGTVQLPNGLVRMVVSVPSVCRLALQMEATIRDCTMAELAVELLEADPVLRARVEEVRHIRREAAKRRAAQQPPPSFLTPARHPPRHCPGSPEDHRHAP